MVTVLTVLTWTVNVACILALAFLAQRYRNQRDDLAAWVAHNHPEDLK